MGHVTCWVKFLLTVLFSPVGKCTSGTKFTFLSSYPKVIGQILILGQVWVTCIWVNNALVFLGYSIVKLVLQEKSTSGSSLNFKLALIEGQISATGQVWALGQ